MKVEDVQLWFDSEITVEFLGMVNILYDDCDIQLHLALTKNELQQAALYNAGMAQLEEVLTIPEIIIDNIKAEEEEDEA